MTRAQRIKETLLGGPSWGESIWSYYLWNWRCQLFGHRWGPEDEEYEDIYHVGTRRYCKRERCDRSVETWSVYDELPRRLSEPTPPPSKDSE